MSLKTQKRLAARILKVGENRVLFDSTRLADIKEAITKEDVRSLIQEGAISARRIKGISKVRFRKKLLQKRKGLRKGAGSRKGKRIKKRYGKKVWMKKVRVLRRVLTEHKKDLNLESYWKIRGQIKAGTVKDKRNLLEMINKMKLMKA